MENRQILADMAMFFRQGSTGMEYPSFGQIYIGNTRQWCTHAFPFYRSGQYALSKIDAKTAHTTDARAAPFSSASGDHFCERIEPAYQAKIETRTPMCVVILIERPYNYASCLFH